MPSMLLPLIDARKGRGAPRTTHTADEAACATGACLPNASITAQAFTSAGLASSLLPTMPAHARRVITVDYASSRIVAGWLNVAATDSTGFGGLPARPPPCRRRV